MQNRDKKGFPILVAALYCITNTIGAYLLFTFTAVQMMLLINLATTDVVLTLLGVGMIFSRVSLQEYEDDEARDAKEREIKEKYAPKPKAPEPVTGSTTSAQAHSAEVSKFVADASRKTYPELDPSKSQVKHNNDGSIAFTNGNLV